MPKAQIAKKKQRKMLTYYGLYHYYENRCTLTLKSISIIVNCISIKWREYTEKKNHLNAKTNKNMHLTETIEQIIINNKFKA